MRVILTRWAILLGIVAVSLWGFLWFVMTPQTGNTAHQSELHAILALNDLRSALVSYASAQGVESFPNSLEPLGDPARAAAQFARSAGYQIEYNPAPAGADGTIRGYTMLARPGNFGYRNFYSDESGIVRATRENRPATAEDPPL